MATEHAVTITAERWELYSAAVIREAAEYDPNDWERMYDLCCQRGAGFIGAHTCKELAAHGFQPIAFDNLSRGHRDAVQWGPFRAISLSRMTLTAHLSDISRNR
jgi:hypothetical protein